MSDFTLTGYRALLETLLAAGYRSGDFHDADPKAQDLILRHDLDFSLDAALPLAQTETALGCKATYFVLVRSEFYNVATPAAGKVFEELQQLGHEVGLHLDASLYAKERPALDTAAARECDLLEQVIGAQVRTISFHRPAPALLTDDAPLAGRVHAYQSRFFRRMGYCSDSRGAWGHGAPLDHPAVTAGTALQLLIHPIWWTSECPGNPVETLEALRAHRDQRLQQLLEENCDPYRCRKSETSND